MYFDNGDRVDKAPDWIVHGLKNMTDVGRMNIGFSKIPRVGENLFRNLDQDEAPAVVEMEE